MSNRISGKWAAEAYDLLRIFRRIKNSAYGLLFMEIGWGLFLVLVAKLSPTGGDDPAPAIVGIPWVGPAGATLETRVLDLLVPGAVVIFLLWGLWSNLFSYVSWPLVYCFKVILVALLFVIGIIGVLANVLILPVALPIECVLIERWKRNLGPEVFERLAKDVGEDQARKTLNRRAFDEIKLNRLIFFGLWLWQFLLDRVRSVASQGRIGLAPLQSHNYEEDLNAAKAPSQVFSVAVARVRWRLENLRRLKHIRFVYLPEHWVPQNPTQARRIRRLLGLDALLWGSYLAEDPNKIWLNIDRDYHHAERENRHDATSIIPEIFPWVLEMKPRMLVIDQHKPWDAYVILLLTIIETLKSRHRPGALVSQFLDALYYGVVDSDQLIEHLVFEVLQEMASESADASGDIYPPLSRTVAEIAGQWVALQMRLGLRYGLRYESAKSLMDRLLPILSWCVAIDPSIPENYYRLGALQCLAGKAEEAIRSFAQARQYEVIRNPSYALQLMVSPDVELILLGKDAYPDVALSRYVAYAARAINAGGKESKERIRAGFERSRYFSRLRDSERQSGKEAAEPTALSVLYTLFAEDYDPVKLIT